MQQCLNDPGVDDFPIEFLSVKLSHGTTIMPVLMLNNGPLWLEIMMHFLQRVRGMECCDGFEEH